MLYKNLKSPNALDADGIPGMFIKQFASQLVYPLLILFNDIVRRSTFSFASKFSYRKHIFKKGHRSYIQNYRPIAISSAFSKIFDQILANKLKFKFKDLISHNQQGFRVGKSTITNLITYTHDLLQVFAESGQADLTYIDFSGAFDSVNHDSLIKK